MRYLLSLVCVLALGVMPSTGCSSEPDNPLDPGGRPTGGIGGDGGTPKFSYSVITSSSGDGADLLEELRTSALPTLEDAGAVVYALWGPAAEQDARFSEISEDKIVVMLSWAQIDTELLTTELEALARASQVDTSIWEASLRGEEPLPTGQGFYTHSFNRTRLEDADQWLSLSEESWVTSEPYWKNEVIGVWRDLEVEDRLAHFLRIAWYRDLQHWIDSREFWLEPVSLNLWIERGLLEVDDAKSVASLLEP